jgi:hypothetical protein
VNGLSDLDRAAARRVARAGAGNISSVYDLYGAFLCTPMTLLIQRGIPFEVYRAVFDAAVEMLYDDLARRETGQSAVGSVHSLCEPFFERFGGDTQLTYHICRIVFFAVSGVVEPGAELVTRAMLPTLERTWSVYEDALR